MAEDSPAFYFTPMKTAVSSFLITLLVCLGLSQNAHSVTPPPDGGYPGGNTAEGDNALLNLTSGSYDTALGLRSLERNTEGNFNTAIGAGALLLNSTANENTAIGAGALLKNAAPFISGGNGNTANGAFALFMNSTGSLNTAIGDRALFNTTSGGGNIALGNSAGSNVTTASNVICIGSAGSNVANSCFIGNIWGATVTGGVPVQINGFGRLGTNTSSRRFKEKIKPMEQASEALYSLKPVSFRYKKELDPQGIPQFGLVAEDVEAVNPNLIVRDGEGKVYTVRYEAINAMLLNEFLKEHRTVQEQQKEIDNLKVELKAQKSLIQKVSTQFEVNRSAPQTAVNNH
jgi:hypothetical protein